MSFIKPFDAECLWFDLCHDPKGRVGQWFGFEQLFKTSAALILIDTKEVVWENEIV